MTEAMASLIGGLVGAAVAIVGIVLSSSITSRNDHRRWQREQLKEAYSNSLYNLSSILNRIKEPKDVTTTVPTNGQQTSQIDQEVSKEAVEQFVQACAETERWIQLLVICYTHHHRRRSGEVDKILTDLKENVEKLVPHDLASMKPWTRDQVYQIYTNVRKLAMSDPWM